MRSSNISTPATAVFPNSVRLLLILAGTLALLCPLENGFAGDVADLESGLAAVKSGEYEQALKQFTTLARAGNAEAQHNLAMLYRNGKGVEKDLVASAQWFRKAADQGIADAQYYLGHMYDTGEGLEQNSQYAFIWYRQAAEKGQGLAQINMGVMYANGAGVTQDLEQAYLWFHVAAAQGYKVAFDNRSIIEETIAPEVLEKLKQKGNSYFQRYVLPFQRHKSPYPLSR